MIKDLKDKIVVITGAASGIGRSLAFSFSQRGARLVLADIDGEKLAKIAETLRKKGSEVLDFKVDVSDENQVSEMANKTYEHFGQVDILCNNAGVAAGGPTHLLSLADWKWVMDVNFYGILHGIKAFLPHMLEREESCHIVNTASIAGLLPELNAGPYTVSKFATVGLSEVLAQQYFNTNVKFSVLCPGFVKTELHINSQKLVQDHSSTYDFGEKTTEPFKNFLELFKGGIEGGIDPYIVSEKVIEAISKDIFYITTHPEFLPLIEARTNTILDEAKKLNDVSTKTLADHYKSGDLATYKNENPEFSVIYPQEWIAVNLPSNIPIVLMALGTNYNLTALVADKVPDMELKNVISMISMFLMGMGSDVKIISNFETTLDDKSTVAYEGELEYKHNGLIKMKNKCISVFKDDKIICIAVNYLPHKYDENIKKIIYSLKF